MKKLSVKVLGLFLLLSLTAPFIFATGIVSDLDDGGREEVHRRRKNKSVDLPGGGTCILQCHDSSLWKCTFVFNHPNQC